MKTISCFVLLVSCWASAKTFTHRLRSYPKGDASCHVLAPSVAKLFEQAAGVVVSEVICQKESAYGVDVDIVYEAEAKVPVVSTAYQMGGLFPHRYADLKTCQKQLPLQTNIFEEATGLKAIFSFCGDRSVQGQSRWSPVIEAFGDPVLAPLLGGYMFFSSPASIPVKEYLAGLTSALKARGARLGEVVIHPQLGSSYASVHYYSNKELRFVFPSFTKTLKEEHCLAQREEFSRLLPETANLPYSLYCGPVKVMGQWELNAAFIGEPSVTWRASSEKFEKFEECNDHRDSIVKAYQSHEKNVLGGLCSHELDRQYHVVIFKNG